jgi:hypothetical protein
MATKTIHRIKARIPTLDIHRSAPGKTARNFQAFVFLPIMVNATKILKLDEQGILLLILHMILYNLT